jgi:RND family efflux transporter MFP subunit
MFRLKIAATALLFFLSAGCSNDKAKGGGPGTGAGRSVSVVVQTAKAHPVGEFTDYLATLISQNSAVLQPDVDGQVSKIFVHAGEHVARGTALLEINPQKQQATVQTTQANQRAREAALELTRQDLQRTQGLFKEGIIARQQLDQAQANYDAALANVNANRASIREQQEQLHYFTVRAPNDGIVGDIPVHVGDRVTAQTVLTSVTQGGQLEAYIYVPAEKVSEAKVGTKVAISADDKQPPVQTTITFVSPRMDPQSQLLLVKAAVPNSNGRFKNEQEVHARVYFRQLNAPTIPVTAVSRLGSQAFAFVVEAQDGKEVARQRPIQLGQLVGNDYIVLDGIRPGDRIVVSDTQTLADGVPVKATEASSS